MVTATDLFDEFQRTNRLIRRELFQAREQVEGQEFSHGQNRVLRMLLKHDGCSQKELVTQLKIRPASVSELLTKLEKKGYVRRQQNETDRRVTNFFLTDSGRALVANFEQVRLEYGEEIFSVLNETEKTQLAQILAKLNQNFR
ncbi:MarR family winged helix-turn-helix transcriptional regulator [Enterococcus sp. CSURQ0835]|uniref:MarR family winged helix-turn-helix transcriptional regulator n=1 Tax=Enterococcus sp. CSURQ0835 TaxID=2681394 RepID=UPI00135AB03A|nr:MarR family transcriptional regulator [Enterococcus sp. CSURQ0835]